MLEVTGGPWQARIGRMAYEVTDLLDPSIYPRKGLARNEIIIRIVNDPLDDGQHRSWSCVIRRSDVDGARDR
jgi:hypothetical protein